MPELNNLIIKNSANLKAYYRMEAGALTTDSSGNGYTLTNTNTVAEGTGKYGGGADTGTGNTNKKLSVASALGIAGNANMSVSFWIKMNAEIASGVQVLFNHRSTSGASRYFQVYYNYNGGTRVLQIDNSGGGVNYTITLGTTWHHIVLTRTGTTASEMYVDGVRTAGPAQSANTVAADVTTIFEDTVGNYASCIIDDLAIFSSVLSADQIKELYEGRFIGEGMPEASLVAGYHLNGNSTDFSGNNNHGTDTAITYSLANGKFNQGAGFNGSSSKITIADNALLRITTDFTILAWVKPTVVNINGAIVAKDVTLNNKAWRLIFNSAKMRFTIPTVADIDDTGASVVAGAWQQVGIIHSGTSYKFILNGNINSDITQGTGITAGSTDVVTIGLGFGTYFFNGAIDEVRIYNVAKDANWVRKQYAWSVGKFL